MATPLRAVRVPDDEWIAAQARASENGETVTAVIRRALVAYAATPATPSEGGEIRPSA